VQPGSPAEAAGLSPGDVVLKYNGTEVSDFNHLINLVSTTAIGQKAMLDIWRDRKSLRLEVSVADRSALVKPATAEAARTAAGGILKRPRGSDPATPARPPESVIAGLETVVVDSLVGARKLGLSDNARGVFIAKIEPRHALAGVLHARDLIQAIDGHPLRNPADLSRTLSGHGQHAFQILRTENGVTQTRIVELKLP
jgi:serine protease Do